jgi:uncharacterized membrane protein
MPFLSGSWTDDEVEQWIGGLLRGGVLLAAAVALAGGVYYAAQYGATTAAYGTFRGEPHGLNSVSSILRGVARLESPALVQLGLLLLIATPVARVALSLVAFAVQRDRLYVAVTSLVLALLLYGLFGAGA